MRAETKQKQKMSRRFAILIGVAAAGVMALGAQTASSTTGDPVDSKPPDLQLSGPMKQSPQNVPRNCSAPGSSNCDPCLGPGRPCNLEVRVSCKGDDGCAVRATGKLTNVKMAKLAPYRKSTGPVGAGIDKIKDKVGPGLARYAQRKQVRQALDEGENVKAKVTVKATDDAGNVATAKRTITLVK
jgi:hypothetical protein